MSGTIAILKHAFGAILRNPATTLRTLAPGLALIFAAALALYLAAPEAARMLLGAQGSPAQRVHPSGLMTLLAATLAILLGFVVMAVTWHRFVLLQGPGRDKGLMSSPGIVARYLWRIIMLVLIMIGASVPILFLIGLLDTHLSAAASLGLFTVLTVLASAILGWIGMRLSLVLPATAMSKPMKYADSWAATRPAAGTVFVLTIFLDIPQIIWAWIAIAWVPSSLVLAGALHLMLSILMVLTVTICVTTLYETLVAGRRLED